MNILITGAGGFCGIHFARYLISRGHHLFALMRSHKVAKFPEDLRSSKSITIIEQDLLSLSSLPQKVDVILHAASTSPDPDTTIKEYIFNNIVATQQLAALAERSGVKRIIYLSSISLYGYVDDPILQENSSIRDPVPYGESKHFAELALREETKNTATVSLRLPAILGPYAHRNWFVRTMQQVLRGEEVKIFNPADRINHAVHVQDLAIFIDKLLSHELKGADIMVLGSSGALSIGDIVDKMKAAADSPSKVSVEPFPRKATIISSAHACEHYGYEPAAFESVLERYINWCVQQSKSATQGKNR